MAEKPILFSGEMVRAILSGRKAQTRRVIKGADFDIAEFANGGWQGVTDGGGAYYCDPLDCPYGDPGDQLWVRESFYFDSMPWADGGSLADVPEEYRDHDLLYYPADASSVNWCCELVPECCCGEVGRPKIRPSIHMPRWASRLTLTVKDVRVERLNEITHLDCLSEGVSGSHWRREDGKRPLPDGNSLARQRFAKLWDSINAGRGYDWASNPWVWVVEFEPAAPAAGQEDAE